MPALPHPGRRWILLLLAGMGIALAAVAANPHTVLLTRQLQPVTAERERGSGLYGEVVEFTTNGRITRVHARADRNHNGDYRIFVRVEQPDPRLHAIDVRFRIPGAPLPYNALLIEPPGGGHWPPVTYGRATETGGLRFAVDGLDARTTMVDFYLLADRVTKVPAELAVDITIDLRSSPSLTSWRGTAQVDLPLASLRQPP